MINKKEVVPPKHKPPTDGPENKNRLKRKLQTVEAELAPDTGIGQRNFLAQEAGSNIGDDQIVIEKLMDRIEI